MIDTESDRHGSRPTKPNLTAPEIVEQFPCRTLSVSNTFLRPCFNDWNRWRLKWSNILKAFFSARLLLDQLQCNGHFQNYVHHCNCPSTFTVVSNCLHLKATKCTGWNRYIHGSVAGLPILRGRCKVAPYAGVSLVAAKSSPKRRYVPLVDNR